MHIRPYNGILPTLGERAYIDPAATVIGDVVLGDDVSIWPGTIVRGDVNFIRVGARTNIQDGTVVHVSHDGPHAKLGGFATVIGEDVTIGHEASVSRIGEEQLFYLTSRGLSEAEASTMIVNGFIEPLVKELPMEYAVEMNRLIELQMEGSVG